MKSNLSPILRTALAVGLALASCEPSAAAGRHCRLPAGVAGVRDPAWAVVRVAIDRRGDVRDARVVWESGNRDVTKAALTAVTLATFAPRSASDASTTFDDLYTSACDGTTATRVLPRFGDPIGSAARAILVPSKRSN